MLTNGKDYVRKILLTPIECRKRELVHKESGRIVSGQDYIRMADEDMSCLAVGFYEILYQDWLEQMPLLDSDGYVTSIQFAGDTITSFNTIANLVPQAGSRVASRTPRDTWPTFLQDYERAYHCLANFWLLPLPIGRSSKKHNYYDSVAIFLKKLDQTFTTYKETYPHYFRKIQDIESFCQQHFLDVTLLQQADEEANLYKSKQAEVLIDQANKMMEARAQAIADSCYSKVLEDYFKQWNL